MLALAAAVVLVLLPADSNFRFEGEPPRVLGTVVFNAGSTGGGGTGASVTALATPSDDIVNRIRREYLHDWILVTTRTSRFELRSNDIRHEGLTRLEPRRASSPAPLQIPWSDVERIDVRRRHTLQGALWGAAGGALAGGLFPSVTGFADPQNAGEYAYAGAITGSILGAWIGRWHRTDHAVYVAAPAPVTPPADTITALAPPGSLSDSTSTRAPGNMTASGAAPSAPPSPEVERACGRLSTDDLLRIEGSFGRFVGHASTISPSGLDGLHHEASAASVRSLHSLDWEQVDRVEVQRNGAFRGAVRGALVTTAIAATATGIALAIEGGPQSGEGPYLYQFVAYFGILSIPVGTVIGAVTGAVSPFWKQVYRRQ